MSATTATADVCVGLCGGAGSHDDGHCVQTGVTIPDLYDHDTNIAAYAYPEGARVGVYVDGNVYSLTEARRMALALVDAVDAADRALARMDETAGR